MRHLYFKTALIGLGLVLFGLSGCGSDGQLGPVNGASGSAAASFAGLPPAATTKNWCQQPRDSIDPNTGLFYPDKKGSLLNEQQFLAAWSYDTYLWYQELTYPDPAKYSTAVSYFDVLKTNAKTPSGADKDRFHFSYQTGTEDVGYGLYWSVIKGDPPRQVVVVYNEPNSAAEQLNVARGATLLEVDGVNVVSDNTQSGVNTINAGLFPSQVGETHVFKILDVGATQPRTVALTASAYTISPVQNVKTLANGTVGYMLFTEHIRRAESALIDAFTQLRSAGVSDLVLDIRYNGGGIINIASQLAYMVAGPSKTQGKTFELLTANGKISNDLTPFIAQSSAGVPLPYLGLNRVFVLTGNGTCSASESIINGLRGVGVEVIQIGSTTCGKPYAFVGEENCGTTYFTIQYQGFNALGFGDYTDGFVPQNGNTNGFKAQAVLPGCQVADDLSRALGDPAEARLAAALQYRSLGSCPVVSMASQARASSEQPIDSITTAVQIKPMPRSVRIVDKSLMR